MAVYWTTMVYKVSAAETSVRHVVCHDADAELAFKISVVPIGADVRVSTVREERVFIRFSALLMLLRWMFRSPSLGCDAVT